MLSLVFVKGFFVYGNDYVMARVGHKLSFRLRNTLYQRIVSASLGTLREERIGDLMTRITDDVRVWQILVAAMANIIRAVVLVPLFLSVMLIRSFKLTLFTLLILPFLAYLITSIGAKNSHRQYRDPAAKCRHLFATQRDAFRHQGHQELHI